MITFNRLPSTTDQMITSSQSIYIRDTNRAVTRKKSVPEVKCRIEESTLDNKVGVTGHI